MPRLNLNIRRQCPGISEPMNFIEYSIDSYSIDSTCTVWWKETGRFPDTLPEASQPQPKPEHAAFQARVPKMRVALGSNAEALPENFQAFLGLGFRVWALGVQA